MRSPSRLPRLTDAGYAPLIAGVVFVGVIQALVWVALPVGLGWSFDSLTGVGALTTTQIAAFFGIVAVVGFGVRYFERDLSERLGQKYVHAVRLRLWDHMVRLPSSRVSGQRRGATVLRFIGDINALKGWISRGLVASVVAGLALLGGLSGLAWVSLRIGALIAGLLIVAGLAQWLLNRRLGARVAELRRSRSRLATDIVERVSSLALIQSENQTKRERARLARRSSAIVDNAAKVARSSGLLRGSGEFVSILLLAAVMVAGGWEVRSGNLTAGELVGCLIVARYLGRPLRRLSRVQEQWTKASISRTKLEQFLAIAPVSEPSPAVRMKDGNGSLRLRELSDGNTLPPVSARVAAGERVRIQGPNGVGKSTLLRLIAGLDRPRTGKIAIDGRDLARVRSRDIRAEVALVSPAHGLMQGTVRRNLTYGAPRVRTSELKSIIESVGLSSWLADLPLGLDTRVSDAGASLSEGEKQRIRIARALLTEPRILLLDEAHAFLDDEGRTMLRRIVERFAGTVLFVWDGDHAPKHDLTWTLGSEGLSIVRSQRRERQSVIDIESVSGASK